MTMKIQAKTMSSTPRRDPWNKGKFIGQKPPLRQSTFGRSAPDCKMDGRTHELPMLAGCLATISFHHHLPRFTELN
jgi:hypothetical protein